MMTLHKFNIQQCQNQQYFYVLADVLEAASVLNAPTGSLAETIILEDFGTALGQLAWSDVTGWYVKFRVSPYVRGFSTTTPEKLERIELQFIEEIEARVPRLKAEKRTILRAQHGHNVTVVWETERYSIGD